MADWGVGIYENDDAMDWIYDLVESSSLIRLKQALDIITHDNIDSVEIADCRVALAAADLVAGLDGDMNPYLPEEAEDWITIMNRSAASLRVKAGEVVRKILKESRLRASIEANGNLEEWEKRMRALLKRLEP